MEKHINSVFSKLDLSSDLGDASVHRRVKAVLLFLSDSDTADTSDPDGT